MHYLAEFYLPGGAAPEELARMVRSAADQAARDGADVDLLQVIFVPEDESGFALYRAASAHQVTTAADAAGLTFDRIMPALSISGSDPRQAEQPRPVQPGAGS